MKSVSRIVILSLVALGITACATQQPDYTPPAAKHLDAKTTLENRR
jgi:predicted small lipoprotein YifL